MKKNTLQKEQIETITVETETPSELNDNLTSKSIESSINNPASRYPTVIPTGYSDLDDLLFCKGFQSGNFIIIGGKAGSGKTGFIMSLIGQILHNDKEIPILFFSPKTDKETITSLLLANFTRINSTQFFTGKHSKKDHSILSDTAKILSEKALWIDDTPGIPINVLSQKAREAKQNCGIKLIIIDHLQLVEGSKNENQYSKLNRISRKLRRLARELDITILVTSSLNRNSILREHHENKPILTDLRGSGTLEDDADVVMFIHRVTMECEMCLDSNKICDKNHETNAEIILAKQSGGPTGTVNLTFVKQFNLFIDSAAEKANRRKKKIKSFFHYFHRQPK